MKPSILLFALALLLPSLSRAAEPASTQLTEAEATLAQLINNYRQSQGLAPVPLSMSLSKVAQTHAWDTVANPPVSPCNAHSWSSKGGWSSLCYYNGVAGNNMWSKPRELTSYAGNGFEISVWSGSSTISPQNALSGWQSSAPHNDVILNRAPWTTPWRAMGVGIYQGVAHVWFGNEVDPVGAPLPGNLNPNPVITAGRYYRLKNMRLEAENKCLEGNANAPGSVPQGAAHMATCGASQGQAWTFVAQGGGYYRLTTAISFPQNKSFEGNQYPNGSTLRGAAFLDNTQYVSGQFWSVAPTGGHGYMQVTTMFRAPYNECFIANPIATSFPLGGAAHMSKCDNLASQLWRIEPF